MTRRRTYRGVLAAVLPLILSCGHGKKAQPDPATNALTWDVQEALRLGEHDRTLTLADSALRLVPDYAPLHFVRGRVLTALYRFDEAGEAFERTLVLDPGYPMAHYNLGNNAFFLGRHRAALKHYRRELSSGGTGEYTEGRVHAQIGRVYARLGAADSARLAFEESLGIQGGDAQTWAWLAELSEDEGDLEQALAEARRAFGAEPENVDYQYLVGALSFNAGELDEAEGHLRAVVRAAPWHAGAHYNLGRCLIATGREADAEPFLTATDRLQELDRAIVLAKFDLQLDPLDRQRWLNLAEVYKLSGRRREAAEAMAVARRVGR